MPKLPSLQYCKFVRAKGAVYGYFDTGKKDAQGKRIYSPLGKHSAAGFGDRYTTLKGHRERAKIKAATVNDIADRYEASADFNRLALGSRKFYLAHLKHIREHLGDFPLEAVKRRHIAVVVGERLGDRVGTINGFLAVFSAMYAYAVSIDLAEQGSCPTKHVKPRKTGSHEPWPEQLLMLGLQAEHDRTRLAIHLLYYTGQRIGDVMRMRWNWIKDGHLHMTQQKTGKPLEIALHSALLAELAQTPRTSLTILASIEGQPMTDQVIRRELKAFGDLHGETVVPHGLRKNAVIALLEAGCTVAEVQAITGQSYRIVEQYARGVSQRRLGGAAILKLERKAKVQTNVQTS